MVLKTFVQTILPEASNQETNLPAGQLTEVVFSLRWPTFSTTEFHPQNVNALPGETADIAEFHAAYHTESAMRVQKNAETE